MIFLNYLLRNFVFQTYLFNINTKISALRPFIQLVLKEPFRFLKPTPLLLHCHKNYPLQKLNPLLKGVGQSIFKVQSKNTDDISISICNIYFSCRWKSYLAGRDSSRARSPRCTTITALKIQPIRALYVQNRTINGISAIICITA